MKRSIFFLVLVAASFNLAQAAEDSSKMPFTRTLEEGAFVYCNPEAGTFLHKGKHFYIVTETSGHLSEGPYVSIGDTPFCREIISWDPKHAPLLERHYRELLKVVVENATSLEELLWLTMSYVKHDLFCHNSKSEDQLQDFLAEWIHHSERRRGDFTLTWDGFLFAVIPLEDFIRAKRGVCRHLAPAVAYMLDKLQKEEQLKSIFPTGEIYIARNELTVGKRTGHHAWNIYLSQDGKEAWHLDPTWEVLKNIYTQSSDLYRQYGKEVMNLSR